MLSALVVSAAAVGALTPLNVTPSRALPLTPPASPPPPPQAPPPQVPPDVRADLKAVLNSVMRTESAIQVAWASDLAECRERLVESDLHRLQGMWTNIAVGVLCILWAATSLVAVNVFLALRLRRIAHALTNGNGVAVKARLLSTDRDGVEEEEEDVHAGKRTAAAKASAKTASGAPVEAMLRSCRGTGTGTGTGGKRAATPMAVRPGARGGGGRGGNRAGSSRGHAGDDDDEHDALYE